MQITLHLKPDRMFIEAFSYFDVVEHTGPCMPVALLSACMATAVVDMAYQAVMYHNFGAVL